MSLYGCAEELKIHPSLVSINDLESCNATSVFVILTIHQQMC